MLVFVVPVPLRVNPAKTEVMFVVPVYVLAPVSVRTALLMFRLPEPLTTPVSVMA